MKIEKLGLTGEESQFIDARKFSRSDIAMFFGVPPHMLGDVDKQTSWGSGIEQQAIGFKTNVVQPVLTNIENVVDRALLTPGERLKYFARFDTTPLVQMDFKSQVDGLVALKNAGFINANEGRRRLHMNPRDDEFGDDYVVPANMTSQVIGQSAASEAQQTLSTKVPKQLPAGKGSE